MTQLFELLGNLNPHKDNTASVIAATNAGNERSVRLEYLLNSCQRREECEQLTTQRAHHVWVTKPLGVCQRRDWSTEEQRLL